MTCSLAIHNYISQTDKKVTSFGHIKKSKGKVIVIFFFQSKVCTQSEKNKILLKSIFSFPYVMTVVPSLPNSVQIYAYFLSKIINNICFYSQMCLVLGNTFLVKLILTILFILLLLLQSI